MRLPALAVPAILIVGGAGYFFAKPKEDQSLATLLARLDQPSRQEKEAPGTWPMTGIDREGDDADAEILSTLGQTRTLTERQTIRAINAAARRYMRRKQAYEAAKYAVESRRASEDILEPLQKDMASARRIYELAESLGRLTLIARAERDMEIRMRYAPSMIGGLADRHIGTNNVVTDPDLAKLQEAFQAEFGKPLPISAQGASSVHRSMGFDHSGRVDVAVSPEKSEGVWLRRYLIGKGFSYFAFRSAVSGQSTGAHIHIGSASHRRGSN